MTSLAMKLPTPRTLIIISSYVAGACAAAGLAFAALKAAELFMWTPRCQSVWGGPQLQVSAEFKFSNWKPVCVLKSRVVMPYPGDGK